MKESIGIITVILAYTAYAPYIRDILKGKTKPHPYSWFVWGLITTVIFALQVTNGAGPGSYVTLSVGVLSFVVFFLGLKKNGVKDITKLDTVAFISAIVATVIWLFAKQPLASMILLITIDLLGFIPTIRKSWNKPKEETLFTWSLNGFRHGLSISAIRDYNAITLLNPVVWAIANTIFSLILIIRRRKLQT